MKKMHKKLSMHVKKRGTGGKRDGGCRKEEGGGEGEGIEKREEEGDEDEAEKEG